MYMALVLGSRPRAAEKTLIAFSKARASYVSLWSHLDMKEVDAETFRCVLGLGSG